MSGFGKVTFVAEHFSNSIVNVLWFRSQDWIPGQGNPFDDVQAFVEAVWATHETGWKYTHNVDTRLLRLEGVGYDDSFNIVTSSPIIKTIDEAGIRQSTPVMGSYQSATIGLRCGEQHQINGIGQSRRNRGYLSVGPITEADVDNYGHITSACTNDLAVWAPLLDNPIVLLVPAVTLVPIRIHEKFIGVGPLKVLVFRTYSDVLGYTLPRKGSVRRSRMGEA